LYLLTVVELDLLVLLRNDGRLVHREPNDHEREEDDGTDLDSLPTFVGTEHADKES